MIVACWSGPRNISTALMRSWTTRKDTFVTDEPFYAYYLKETNFNHPMKNEILKNQESKWNKIISICSKKKFHGFLICYQKHMSHHIFENSDLSWLKNINNCILIRHPKEWKGTRMPLVNTAKNQTDVSFENFLEGSSKRETLQRYFIKT